MRAAVGQFHAYLPDGPGLGCGIQQYMGPAPLSYASTVVGLPETMTCS